MKQPEQVGTVTPNSEKDLVVEARGYARDGWCPPRASTVITRLCDEIERLRNLAREFEFNEGDEAEGRILSTVAETIEHKPFLQELRAIEALEAEGYVIILVH